MLNPLSVEILWQRLISVADQMATTLTRTAFSNTITASNDFGCVIMDETGACIAHAQRSLPIFNRTMPYTTRLVLERFSGEIRPGDIFIANDPWENAGHNPDITVITPIFYMDALVGFTATIAHHSDIGGALDINQVRDCYEEGLMIPLMRLYEEGSLNRTLVAFLEANVRLPRVLLGDIQAQAAANETGAGRCRELLSEYSLPDLRSLSLARFRIVPSWRCAPPSTGYPMANTPRKSLSMSWIDRCRFIASCAWWATSYRSISAGHRRSNRAGASTSPTRSPMGRSPMP